MWLIGVFSYLFFYEEIHDKKWAFLSSVVYQLSGYTIYFLQGEGTYTIQVYSTIALFIVWTIHHRPSYLNLIYLTLALTATYYSSFNLQGSFHLLMVGVLTIYRYLSTKIYRARHILTVFWSFALFMTIALAWIIPAWDDLSLGNRIGVGVYKLWTASPFMTSLHLFIPEAFGIHYGNSVPIFDFIPTTPPRVHTHGYMFQFFGTLAMLLIALGIMSQPKKSQGNFWSIYIILALLLLVYANPFQAIFHMLLHSTYHPYANQVLVPLGASIMVGLSGKYLEERGEEFSIDSKPMAMVLFVCAIVLLTFVALGLACFPTLVETARTIIHPFLILLILSLFAYHQWSKIINRTLNQILPIVGLSLLAFIVVYNLGIKTDPNGIFLSHYKNMSASMAMLLVTGLWSWSFTNKNMTWNNLFTSLAPIIIAICLLVMLYPWSKDAGGAYVLPREQSLTLALMGLGKFLLVSMIFVTVVTSWSQKKISAKLLFPLLLCLVLFDQLPANKVHTYMVKNPFESTSSPFAPVSSKFTRNDDTSFEFDNKNYRINRPGFALRELNSLKEHYADHFVVAGMRSYGGHYPSVYHHYAKFVRAFSPNAAINTGLWSSVDDERFLDLIGVGYDYKSAKGIEIRPTALSRFMLFRSYEVMPNDDEALARLKDPEFSPKKVLILNEAPNFPNNPVSPAQEKLEYIEHNSDNIELNIETETPGLVFFGDTYHKGWKVTVNGQEQSIIQADFNFMAIPVPAGKSLVKFHFFPDSVSMGLWVGGVGVGLFFLSATGMYVARRRIDGEDFLDKAIFTPKILSDLPDNYRWTSMALGVFAFVASAQAILNYKPAYSSSKISNNLEIYELKKNDGKTYHKTQAKVKITASTYLFPDAPRSFKDLWYSKPPLKFPQWLEAKYSYPVRKTLITIQAQSDGPENHEHKRAPKDFVLLGSNDHMQWDPLLEVENALFKVNKQGQRTTWTFPNKNSYKYYRLEMLANNGDVGILSIANWALSK